MKQSVRDLKRDRLRAVDGVIGFIHDVYIDPERWTVRYLIVDIGALLPGRRVLIGPDSMAHDPMRDPNGTSVKVNLTREAVRHSADRLPPGDEDMRSARGLLGHDIEARDGPAGELHDLIIDDDGWVVSEAVVDIRKWWPGGHVRIAPACMERIDPGARRISLRLTVDEVRASPPAR